MKKLKITLILLLPISIVAQSVHVESWIDLNIKDTINIYYSILIKNNSNNSYFLNYHPMSGKRAVFNNDSSVLLITKVLPRSFLKYKKGFGDTLWYDLNAFYIGRIPGTGLGPPPPKGYSFYEFNPNREKRIVFKDKFFKLDSSLFVGSYICLRFYLYNSLGEIKKLNEKGAWFAYDKKQGCLNIGSCKAYTTLFLIDRNYKVVKISSNTAELNSIPLKRFNNRYR